MQSIWLKRILLGVLSIICIIGICVLTAYYTLLSLFAPRPSERESAVRQVEEILALAEQYPTGRVPASDPQFDRYQSLHPDCWQSVQTLMRQSNNQRTVRITRYDDSRDMPYPVHDTIEIEITIEFAARKQMLMIFFQGGLAECRQVE